MKTESYSIVDDIMNTIHEGAVYMSDHSPEDEGYKTASQYVVNAFKLLNEADRIEDDRVNAEELRRIDEADRERKAEIEERKVDLEERKTLVEEVRVTNEAEAAERDLKQKEKSDRTRLYLEIAGIGVSVLGLVIGCSMAKTAYNVNLESYVANKDAVSSSMKIIEHFWKRS